MSRQKAAEATPDGISSQVGPWGMVPAWVLLAKDEKGKGLTAADLRVYISLRSFADRWGAAFPHVPTIAARADVTPRTAERSITRMREMGLIVSKRRYRSDGSIAGCDYQLRDVPPTPDTARGVPTSRSVPPDEPDGTSRPDGRSNNTPGEHTTETPQRSDQGSTTSGRFAPSGGGTKDDDFEDPWEAAGSRQPKTAEKLTQKRAADRDLFLQLIDAQRLRSDGSTFREGVFDTHLFYDGFRRVKLGEKKIGFPGAYVQSMYTTNQDSGVWDWLLSVGLEPA